MLRSGEAIHQTVLAPEVGAYLDTIMDWMVVDPYAHNRNTVLQAGYDLVAAGWCAGLKSYADMLQLYRQQNTYGYALQIVAVPERFFDTPDSRFGFYPEEFTLWQPDPNGPAETVWIGIGQPEQAARLQTFLAPLLEPVELVYQPEAPVDLAEAA